MYWHTPALIGKLKKSFYPSSFCWYIKRLRRMKPEEIFFRFLDILRKSQLTLFPKGLRCTFSYLDFDWRSIQTTDIKEKIGSQISVTDSVMVYGKEWPFSDSNGIHWQIFLSGIDSKKTKAFKVQYRNLEAIEDDVRFSWELNRMTWVYPFAFSTEESRNLRALEYLKDFIKSDNPGYGLRWNSMIEIAIQSISLLILSSKFASNLTESEKELLEVSLSSRFRWLEKLPSRYSSNNNHRIAELTALIFLSECSGAQKRSYKYQNQLVKELNRQTLTDGFNAELSPSYHLFVLELTVLLCTLFPRLKYLSELRSIARRMLKVALEVEKINQVWPTFNDSDEAMLLSVLVPPQSRIEFLSNFFGESYSAENRKFLTLFDAGYTFLKHEFGNSEISIAIDHGNIGFGEIAAHGHADSLALWLVINKIPLLVESGTYSYHSNLAMRNYLRSGFAHNTITIDEESLSSPEGPFLWNPQNCAQSTLLKANYKCNQGIIQVKAIYKKTNKHKTGIALRKVSIVENCLTIEDSATSGETIESHFIISPIFQFKETIGNVQFLFTNNEDVSFTISCGPRNKMTIMPTSISPSYGVLNEGFRVTVHGKSENITRFRFNEME